MRRGLFGDRDVRLLWSATACMSAAFWMLQISVALHVLAIAGTAALAAVQLAGVLPALLLMPVAGLAADRMRIRPLLLWAVTAQSIAVVGMAVGAWAGSIPALAVCYAAQSFAMAFWPSARQQWLYGLVEPGSRQRANAAFGSLGGIMTIVGAIAAGLVSAWSPVAAIGGAVTLMACGAMILARVRETPPVKPAATNERILTRVRVFMAGLREGFGATRRFPLARSVIWIGIAWGFIGGGYTVMLSGHVVDDLGGDAATVAAVFVCDGLAVLAGTVLAGRLRRSAHLPVWAVCYVVQGLAWAGFFAAPGLAGAVACLAVMRLSGGFIIALDTTILLETVPAEFRGRVTSIHVTTYNATARLSLAVLGAALGWATLTALGIAAGLLATATGIAWWLFAGSRSQAAYREAAPDPVLPGRWHPGGPSHARVGPPSDLARAVAERRRAPHGPTPVSTSVQCRQMARGLCRSLLTTISFTYTDSVSLYVSQVSLVNEGAASPTRRERFHVLARSRCAPSETGPATLPPDPAPPPAPSSLTALSTSHPGAACRRRPASGPSRPEPEPVRFRL